MVDISQIASAILAAAAVLLATRELREAREERRASVRPDWDVDRAEASGFVDHASWFQMTLLNTGFGAARHPGVSFEPHNGHSPVEQPLPTFVGGFGKVGVPGGKMRMYLRWCRTKPLRGIASVTCHSQAGEILTHKFYVHTWTASNGQAMCRAERLD